jgi:hypothetical protein
MSADEAKELEWYQRLERDYRGLFTLFPECNAGWESILREVFDVVKANVSDPAQFGLFQVKEKFGGLRVYYSLDGASDKASVAIREAVDAAEQKSLKTCELTGKPGKLISRGGYICVRSDEHIKNTDVVLKQPD